MKLTAQTSTVIAGPRQDVFDYATNNDTYERRLNQAFGPVAGIAKAEMVEGHTLQTGALRNIHMKDGSVVAETITEHNPPNCHQYEWTTGPKPPASWMVRRGIGTWNFSEVDGGTRVDWTYDFELRSPLAYPMALGMVAMFRRWMEKGLASMRDGFVPVASASAQTTASQTEQRLQN